MNQIEHKLKSLIIEAVEASFNVPLEKEDIVIEIPREISHGDYSTNIAMRLTKSLKKNPREIATTLVEYFIKADDFIEEVDIAGPGFINFKIKKEHLRKIIKKVLSERDQYGNSNSGNGLRVNVEYVSVNPTGDIHPGHGRLAAIGDSVTRILKKAGYVVTREYYLNDAGQQIINMAKSLQVRYFQQFGQDMELPEDGYFGEDIVDIATELINEVGDKYLSVPLEDSLEFFREYGLEKEKDKLLKDLRLFRVEFDVWTSESSIYERGLVIETLNKLRELQMTYEHEGAVWLKTSSFSDDKDRVLIKSDGSYTYLTPDIAYHLDKFNRGYQKCIDLLGADHHGYINRLKSSLQALGYQADDLEVDIIQMVRMIKDGEEYKLSKRSGKALALRDLIEEVGVDALRYFFVSRAGDTHLELDIDLATKQSNENPVYYAQYAHARMSSILKQGVIYDEAKNYDLIAHEKELELLKLVNEFPSLVADSAATRQPHKICNYIQKLAASFHSFYSECKVLDPDNSELSSQRIALVEVVRITLKNALFLIGVEAPEHM